MSAVGHGTPTTLVFSSGARSTEWTAYDLPKLLSFIKRPKVAYAVWKFPGCPSQTWTVRSGARCSTNVSIGASASAVGMGGCELNYSDDEIRPADKSFPLKM